jgi:hypothetical protein
MASYNKEAVSNKTHLTCCGVDIECDAHIHEVHTISGHMWLRGLWVIFESNILLTKQYLGSGNLIH